MRSELPDQLRELAQAQDGVLTRNAPGKPAQVIKGHMSFSYVGACPAAAKPGS